MSPQTTNIASQLTGFFIKYNSGNVCSKYTIKTTSDDLIIVFEYTLFCWVHILEFRIQLL